MAIINISETSSNDKATLSDMKVKKSGVYQYIDTEYEGVKKVVSHHGGYLAILDYGRKLKVDKKTGALVSGQSKSTKHVATEAEARRLRREAEAIRKNETSYDGKPSKKKFGEAIEDFMRSERYLDISDSYKDHAINYIRHARDYFINQEPKNIAITDMEKYFKYLHESGNKRTPGTGICISSISKHKTVLKKIWEFFIDSKRYGVTENVADRARLPRAEIIVDGKVRKVNKEVHNPRPYTLEELNYTLNDIAQYEFDRSLLVMVALAAIGSLRRSEMLGLKLGKFYHNEFMNVTDDACNYGGFDKKYYEEHDSLMLIDTAIIKIGGKDIEKLPKTERVRVSAIPQCLKEIVEYAIEQRREIYDIIGRKLQSNDYIYMPMINIIENRPINSKKVNKKWAEYQARRTKRMIADGLEPIPDITYHELRHTHSNLCKVKVPSWEISCNMGHIIPDANTTQKIYWTDRQPFRDDIIELFDSHIQIDWDKAMRVPINNVQCRVQVNSSGHLVVSPEEKAKHNKHMFTDEEYEEMFLPLKENTEE